MKVTKFILVVTGAATLLCGCASAIATLPMQNKSIEVTVNTPHSVTIGDDTITADSSYNFPAYFAIPEYNIAYTNTESGNIQSESDWMVYVYKDTSAIANSSKYDKAGMITRNPVTVSLFDEDVTGLLYTYGDHSELVIPYNDVAMVVMYSGSTTSKDVIECFNTVAPVRVEAV